MKKLLVALSLAIACASTPLLLMAQDGPKLPDRVDRLVNRLRSDNQELRKTAEEDLRDLGPDAKELLKRHRDAAKKAGNEDLVESIERIIGKPAEPVKNLEHKAEAPAKAPAESLPKAAPQKSSESYSTLQLSLWSNGKATSFSRDAEGRFKVTEREGQGEAKTQEFTDEADFKAKAPALYETFRSVAPNFGPPALPKKDDAEPQEDGRKGFGDFERIFDEVERILPEDMREKVKAMREKMKDIEKDGDPFEKIFKDFGNTPDSPEGDPLKAMRDQMDKLFKDFGLGRNPFDRGEGGKLPKDSKKDENEEEHY